MTQATVVRYQTSPEAADENERLIRAVFAELNEEQPEGLRYASFRLDDGVSFLHVAIVDAEVNPLTKSAAFAEFQGEIGARVVEGPTPSGAKVIASYRLPVD